MRRDDPVHTDNLVVGLSDHEILDLVRTAVIVGRLDGLGYLSLFQILDSLVILGLQLVDLEIRRTGIWIGHLSAVCLGGSVL